MRPVNEATTMPGAVYHDQNFFDIEKKRVWEDSWVAVAEVVSSSAVCFFSREVRSWWFREVQ
jgi:hypothetical protein